MQRRVTTERHTAPLHFLADLLEQPVNIALGVSSPLGKVHILTRLIDVTDDKP